MIIKSWGCEMIRKNVRCKIAGGEYSGFRPVSGHFACVPKAIKDVPIQIEFASRTPYSFGIGRSNKQMEYYK